MFQYIIGLNVTFRHIIGLGVSFRYNLFDRESYEKAIIEFVMMRMIIMNVIS